MNIASVKFKGIENIYTRSKQEIKQTVNGEYGRIREIIKGPDNMLYISTSNRDGRGLPSSDDDKIIRINPLLIAQ